MLRKWMSIFLVLALLCSLTACVLHVKEEEESVKGENSELAENQGIKEDPTEPVTEKSEIQDMEPEVDYSAQLALLAASKESWTELTGFMSGFSFAVTDLDQNGRLELILTECAGSGMYSRNLVIEVTEDMTGVVPYYKDAGSVAEDLWQSDLIYITETDVYYDRDNDIHYYAVFNATRAGWAWNGNDKIAFWLKDGAVNEAVVAEYSCESFEDGTSVEKYYDMSGNELTEAEYEAAMGGLFAACEKMTAKFSWEGTSAKELSATDEATLISFLEESWQGFSLS